MDYTQKLNNLVEDASKDIIQIHSKLLKVHGKPPMVVFPNYPEQKTNYFEIPVREFKTQLNGFVFKLSAIGIEENTVNGDRYYIRAFTTTRRSYKRISFHVLEPNMLLEFTDHLKNHYKNL